MGDPLTDAHRVFQFLYSAFPSPAVRPGLPQPHGCLKFVERIGRSTAAPHSAASGLTSAGPDLGRICSVTSARPTRRRLPSYRPLGP